MPSPPDTPPLTSDLAPSLVIMVNKNLGNLCVSMSVLDRLTRFFDQPADVLVDARYLPLAEASLPGRRAIGMARPLWRSVGLGGRLTTRGYRVVIDVSGGIRSTALAAATRARRRIGLDSSRRSWMYTHRVATAGAVHTLDRYAQLLACIGGSGRPPLTSPQVPVEDRSAVERMIREHLSAEPGPLVVLHCGAGQEHRLWPAERFAAVCDGLVERCGASVCIIGVPSERPLMQRVHDRMARRDRACLLFPSLLQLVALCEMSSLMLCNESGPMHVAAMTEVPIVATFGPTPEPRWAPVREDRVTMLRGAPCEPGCGSKRCPVDRRCLRELPVDRALDAACRLIAPAPQFAPTISPA